MVGSMPKLNVGLLADRSLKTFIQLSLMLVANGDMGVAATDEFDEGDVTDVGVKLAVDEVFNSIALSRKRAKALADEKRKAINNFIVRMIVRG